MKASRLQFGITTAVALAITVGFTAPAQALEPGQTATADLISEASPNEGPVAKADVTGDDIVAKTDTGTATIPLEASGVIEMASDDGISLSLSLPSGIEAQPAHVSEDETVVYDSTGQGDVSVGVQTFTDGRLAVQTVLETPQAPRIFEYAVNDDLRLEHSVDGGIDIFSQVEGEAIGHVAPAWAFDADGAPVATHYSITGNRFTQVVEPAVDSTFPIVADPTVSLGWRYYVKFNKAETKNIANSGISSKAKYAAIVCAVIGNAPLAAACGLTTYDIISSVVSTFKSARDVGKCTQLGYLPTPSGLVLTSWNVVKC